MHFPYLKQNSYIQIVMFDFILTYFKTTMKKTGWFLRKWNTTSFACIFIGGLHIQHYLCPLPPPSSSPLATATLLLWRGSGEFGRFDEIVLKSVEKHFMKIKASKIKQSGFKFCCGMASLLVESDPVKTFGKRPREPKTWNALKFGWKCDAACLFILLI